MREVNQLQAGRLHYECFGRRDAYNTVTAEDICWLWGLFLFCRLVVLI